MGKSLFLSILIGELAEREGFEPSDGLPHRLISSQVHSTTLPPLRDSKARLYSGLFGFCLHLGLAQNAERRINLGGLDAVGQLHAFLQLTQGLGTLLLQLGN